MTDTLEVKQLALGSVALKFNDSDRTFSGYASVFGGVDAYGDTIVRGAYADTLQNRTRPIRMKWNHRSPTIGKWTTIREDEKGLYVEGQLTPGHSVAEDVYASLKHGAVDGLSIGYRIPANGAEHKDGIRYLKRIDLIEISPVEEPADGAALVSSVKDMTSAREMEKGLREHLGLSKRQARRFMSKGMSGLSVSDAEEEAAEVADALRQLNELLQS